MLRVMSGSQLEPPFSEESKTSSPSLPESSDDEVCSYQDMHNNDVVARFRFIFVYLLARY